MNIIESLSRDIGEILQLELTNSRLDNNRLSIHLLLLLGHRRHVKIPHKTARPLANAEDDDFDECEDQEQEEQTSLHANDKVIEIKAFKTLQENVKAFHYANPYIKKLLFRDFRDDGGSEYENLFCLQFGNVFIHKEAILYLNEVLLLRPLQLARKNGDKPTNLHLLLKTLCHFSNKEGSWIDTEIARSHTAAPKSEDWFAKLAGLLQKHDALQGDKISATASNRRKLSGPYWLTAGECREKISEELSLQDVLKMAPTPLGSDFAKKPEFSDILKGTIDSLNMRYRCLRSAGLPPEEWLRQDKPSIEELKKLARLRRRLVATEEWINDNIEAGFCQGVL